MRGGVQNRVWKACSINLVCYAFARVSH